MIGQLAELFFEQTMNAFDQSEDATPHIYYRDGTFHFSLEIDFMHGGKAVIFYPNELVTVINNDSRETALFILIDKMTRYHERE